MVLDSPDVSAGEKRDRRRRHTDAIVAGEITVPIGRRGFVRIMEKHTDWLRMRA
jgi:hypothetical protein